MPSPTRTLTRLARQVAELAALVAAGDARLGHRAAEVSGWSVGEHAQHLALTDLAVLRALERHERGQPIGEIPGVRPTTRGISPVGRLVLITGWIPRGKGRAPQISLPGSVEGDRLRTDLAEIARRVDALAGDPGPLARSTARVPHPVFGGLSAGQWLRFLEIHHHHHQRIVRDIERRLPE